MVELAVQLGDVGLLALRVSAQAAQRELLLEHAAQASPCQSRWPMMLVTGAMTTRGEQVRAVGSRAAAPSGLSDEDDGESRAEPVRDRCHELVATAGTAQRLPG